MQDHQAPEERRSSQSWAGKQPVPPSPEQTSSAKGLHQLHGSIVLGGRQGYRHVVSPSGKARGGAVLSGAEECCRRAFGLLGLHYSPAACPSHHQPTTGSTLYPYGALIHPAKLTLAISTVPSPLLSCTPRGGGGGRANSSPSRYPASQRVGCGYLGQPKTGASLRDGSPSTKPFLLQA